MQSLIASNPHSIHYDEVQFRRGEYFFTRRRFREAESAFAAIIGLGADSSYYEFALYKLGWTLYKQEFYDEAQHRFMALLDYKVSTGYDFDQRHEVDEERRVADTFRVISLGFSNLGGPDVVQEYFAENGRRSYEDRVYANLGEYYLAKLRYDDAAKTLQVVRGAQSVPPRLAAFQHAGRRDLHRRQVSEAGAGGEEGVRGHLWAAGGILASLRRQPVARGAELPEDQPARPRGPSPRAVPEPGTRRRQVRQLRRGAAVVPRVPGLVPRGSRLAADQLPARGPAARERGFRRGGAGVRAHRI